MASETNNSFLGDAETDLIHVFDVSNGSFPEQRPPRIESGDTIEFQNKNTDEEYDLFQVYRDGDDYYRVVNGFECLNLRKNSPSTNVRRLSLSFALNVAEIDLYFCLIRSSQRESLSRSRQCPRENCQGNHLKVYRNEMKFVFTDNKESQKVSLHQGDTIEIEWTSKRSGGYRIEEKRYCPVSGGLYTIEQVSSEMRAIPKGKLIKRFETLGTSFFFRLTETNQVHDILVCVIKEKYQMKFIQITDEDIQPKMITIEENDSIVFHWNTKEKQTIEGEYISCPNEPSTCGYLMHRFPKTGLFSFQTATHQIGYILVEPKIRIHSFPVFGDQLIVKMNTADLVQFEWKVTDSQEDEPILLTIDANSSVVPDTSGGLTDIFGCLMHKCVKVEPFFRQHFHTYESFLLNIPQHGLYNFAYSENRDDVLLSVIVETNVTNHRVTYNDEHLFEPNTVLIHRNDQVSFELTSKTLGNLYRTDEYGHPLNEEEILFRPQMNNLNYFLKQFNHIGIYYFSTDIHPKDPSPPLAVIVSPSIRFHQKLIRLSDFDSQAIITNVNDFIIWQFEQIIRYNMIQLRANETLEDLVSCHERAVRARNRQCIAVECIMPGTFFFANPEFERVTGSEQDRLISTIVIDPPFSQACFLVTDRHFLPNVLHIAQNDSVSWMLSNSDQYHRIDVQSATEAKSKRNEENRLDRSIDQDLPEIHYLYTFNQCGQFTIRSNRFEDTATVIVYTDEMIRSEKKRVETPRLIEEIDAVSAFDTQVHFESTTNREARIFYTLDGTLPTRHSEDVQIYNPDKGIHFTQSGLHVLRAYAIENEKISSSITTSSPTFVMANEELEALYALRSMWSRTKIKLAASIQYPNKLYGKIEVEPREATDLIDHFELYVDDVAQRVNLAPTDVKFSAEGFAGGEQYEIYILAYPKGNVTEVEAIASNKRAFEIKRQIQGGAPLISLAVSNEQSVIFLMWAHIGDHVSEYVVYVDNIQSTVISENNFNDFFGIQFHGAQQRKRYLLHVEAKIKNTDEIRKSNIIAVNPPLEMPLKEQLVDRYFAYITVNAETPPPDMRLEVIHLDHFPNPRPEPQRKIESVPINNGLRNAVPQISSKASPTGVIVFWTRQSQAIVDFVNGYQIMVDGVQYGEILSPNDEPEVPVNLLPGNHECYLNVIPKDSEQEVYQSNILLIDVPSIDDNNEVGDFDHVHRVLEEEECPIPKLTIQTRSASSIRTEWSLDRPTPVDVLITKYELHIRGEYFPDKITSDQKFENDDHLEHVWYLFDSFLDISGIPNRYEYTVFVRALFTLGEGSDAVGTRSNEVIVPKVIPLIELLPQPALKIIGVGLQMVAFSWKFDESVDQSLIKGYRIFVNGKPKEIFSSNQFEYELRNIKSGSTNDIQVSVTGQPDFDEEKLSQSVRILCPPRPQPPIIQSLHPEKLFCIGIKWSIENEVTSFKTFLNDKLHGQIDGNNRPSFQYEFTKLQADQTYSIYIKALIEQKKVDEQIYQCDIESNPSNELILKCLAPPKGTPPRIERMHPNGIDIVWDAPVESEHIKVTGYQILKNGRVIGKSIPIDQRRALIGNLEVGNRYALQVVPITNQSDGSVFHQGEEYDPQRHGQYLPGPTLEVDFTDLVQVPKKLWIEKISGRSAVVCWSPIGDLSNINTVPDDYKLLLWINSEQTRFQTTVISILKDRANQQLRDLRPATTYAIQLETSKRRRYQKRNGIVSFLSNRDNLTTLFLPYLSDSYIVSNTSDILTFKTGSPPDAPSNLHVIACTNTAVRLGFDPFVEHNAEIVTLRVHCQCVSSRIHTKELFLDLTPDSTELTLSNLIERTDYNVTIYAITEEYLNEIYCHTVSQLPKKLKTSDWLVSKSLQFLTSGCEVASQLRIRNSSTQSIELDWTPPKAYGSTRLIGQILRWKLERDEHLEQSLTLDCHATQATIPGVLSFGFYRVFLDSLFSMRINLDARDVEINRKELCLTVSETTSVRFRIPGLSEKPEVYLTGYTTTTIDLTWNKPDMFSVFEHPERLNEQMKIHRRLLGYRVEINGRKYNTLKEDQYQCTLTECEAGEEYKVQLVVQTTVQQEYITDLMYDDEPDETASKKLRVRMLKSEDLLRSFQANFEFHHYVTQMNTSEQRNEVKPLGKIHVHWTISDTKTVSHIVLQWYSSKDRRVQQKILGSMETSFAINACDEKHYYIIEIILVTVDGLKHQYEPLKMPIPGEPDAPQLWLVKTSDSSFIVEWSEPKSYGIPVIGFQLYIEGQQAGEMVEMNLHRAEIPSNINQTYQLNICAVTNHPQRTRSAMSQTLAVAPPPPPTVPLKETQVQRIAVKVEPIGEDKLQVDWTSFRPMLDISAYYVQNTCLNNRQVQTMKVLKRHQHVILRDLKPGFSYGLTVLAVGRSGEILYTSEQTTVQMSAPPNAPIVAIRERTHDHVTLEWRPAPSHGELAIVGYKLFLNNRLAAILSHDQLTYTITSGSACEEYTVYIQALSNDKDISSPLSRGVIFIWPGIKPGAFRRLDDGQTGSVVVAWEHPQLEDETEKLIGYKLLSENISTHAVRLHGQYEPNIHQATIYDLINAKYRLWLEIQSEHYCVRSRPITIGYGRFSNRKSYGPAKCFMKKPKRFRSTTTSTTTPPFGRIRYS